jgi:transketolase-like protein
LTPVFCTIRSCRVECAFPADEPLLLFLDLHLGQGWMLGGWFRQLLGFPELAGLFQRMAGDEKHTWSAASTLHVLWVLYDRVLNISPERVDDPDRDRFLLSKGHGPMAFYAVLAAKGFLEPEVLDSWTEFGPPLGQHPDRVLVPGVEIGSGSLGHGLALGVGNRRTRSWSSG